MLLTGKGRGTMSAPVSRVSARQLPATTTLIDGSASPCPPLGAPPLVSRLGLAVLGGGWLPRLACVAAASSPRPPHATVPLLPGPRVVGRLPLAPAVSGRRCRRRLRRRHRLRPCSPAAPPLHAGASALRHSVAVHVIVFAAFLALVVSRTATCIAVRRSPSRPPRGGWYVARCRHSCTRGCSFALCGGREGSRRRRPEPPPLFDAG